MQSNLEAPTQVPLIISVYVNFVRNKSTEKPALYK